MMKILNASNAPVVISATEYARLDPLKTEHLKGLIQEGIADLQAGKMTNGKTVMDRLRRRAND